MGKESKCKAHENVADKIYFQCTKNTNKKKER